MYPLPPGNHQFRWRYRDGKNIQIMRTVVETVRELPMEQIREMISKPGQCDRSIRRELLYLGSKQITFNTHKNYMLDIHHELLSLMQLIMVILLNHMQ